MKGPVAILLNAITKMDYAPMLAFKLRPAHSVLARLAKSSKVTVSRATTWTNAIRRVDARKPA
jgi:hypothetical protein